MTSPAGAPVVPLSGVPGLDRLERSGRSTREIGGWLIGISMALHLALYVMFAALTPQNAIAALIPNLPPVALYLVMGFLTGAYLMLVIGLQRYFVARVDESLAPVDAKTVRQGEPLEAWFAGMLLLAILVAGVIIFVYHQFLLTPAGFDVFGRAGDYEAGFLVLVFFIIPVNAAAASPLLYMLFPTRRYMLYLAREIRIDILRIDAYASLCLPLVMVLCVVSCVAAILTTVGVLAQSEAFETTMLILMIGMLLVAAFMFCYLGYPILVLRGRIGAHIATERDRVLARLDGDFTPPLRISNQTESDRAGLLAYLLLLDALDPWPVGPHIRKLVVFGVIPPIAWALAAMVENALY